MEIPRCWPSASDSAECYGQSSNERQNVGLLVNHGDRLSAPVYADAPVLPEPGDINTLGGFRRCRIDFNFWL